MMLFYTILTLLTALTLGLILWPVWNAPLPRAGRLRFMGALSVMFLAGVFLLYSLIGAPELLPLMEKRQQRLEELKTVIVTRLQEAKADPRNLAAWVELGDSFMETRQYAAAVNAFKQAVLLSQGDSGLILAYARAQILEADGKVTDEAKKGMDMVLLQDHGNAEARYWLIVRKLQDGHTPEAMQEMKALYHSLPADSPVKAMMDRQMGR